MPPTHARRILAAVGLAALLVTAGCLSGAGGTSTPADTDASTQTPTAEPTAAPSSAERTATPTATPTPTATATPEPPTTAELESAMESELSKLESFTATRTQTTELGNRTVSSTAEVWYRLTTGEYRTEVVAPDDRAGNVAVSGTDRTWSYQAESNTVTVINQTASGTTNTSATMVDALTTNYDVTDYEETTLDGRETYRVELVPESETGVDATVTAWLNQETYFPVAIEQDVELENDSMTTRIEFENVTLNPSIPDERFAFDPPANATVETLDVPETETFDSLPAMRDAVDESVPDPDVPADFTFEQGRFTDGDNTSISLTYGNGTADIHVSKISSALSVDGDGNVTVGDSPARVETYGETTMVSWTCDGSTYSVSGSLDRAQLLDVARSMECA